MQEDNREHLNNEYGCMLQVGGSDQWGNMVAWTQLIRRKSGNEVHVMTTPLLLNSKGEKMGKTSGGALWVDEGKTSVYDFYQYFMNIDDSDVATILRWFSDLDVEVIENMCKEYDAEKELINADVEEFLKVLEDKGLLE